MPQTDLSEAGAFYEALDEGRDYQVSLDTESRERMARSGVAMSDGSFPIPNCDFAMRAIRSIGRAPEGKRDAVRAHIRKRVRALNCTNVPDEWRGRENVDDLQTEDLEGVEILSVGGPVHGRGSPPEGDFWQADDLRRMADTFHELRNEVRAPAKIGHGGDQPAVGWLDNLRLNDGGTHLIADVRRVPQTLAKLIRAGAYRTRSVELSRVTSQATGKKYDFAVTGLAWLGGKLPAVRTLKDVVALYEGDGVERQFLAEQESEELPDVGPLAEAVRDLTEAVLGRAPAFFSSPADTSTVSDETTSIVTDEQARSLAEALGVEGDEITAEQLAEAAAALKEKAEATPEEKRELEESELSRTLAEETAAREKLAEELKTIQEERRLEQRDVFVEGLISSGRVPPADKEKWETRFDRDAKLAREFAEDLDPDETLVREFGSDGDGGDEPTDAEKAYLREFAQREGVEKASPVRASNDFSMNPSVRRSALSMYSNGKSDAATA